MVVPIVHGPGPGSPWPVLDHVLSNLTYVSTADPRMWDKIRSAAVFHLHNHITMDMVFQGQIEKPMKEYIISYLVELNYVYCLFLF